MRLPGWLKHAFAADDGPLTPTPEQAALVDRLAHEVVRRGMTVPALAFLEMSHPLNYVTSQAIHFFTPMIGAVSNTNAHRLLADLLEHRGAIEYICQAIERVQADTAGAKRSS
ncbi:hypothetical protein Pan44_21520 [Caulifigura coniformis]|uniref:Uncharacterized protein n=1 Tax=Caulifigura coniformis TaxID=2527983 RepID=A0A517SDD9_9PLAN|nr:hypothetical protein [Caulifigura coniformis]QDT54125.1 hypothetical protein Pan44_21520 [Caulifigura coniformis]